MKETRLRRPHRRSDGDGRVPNGGASSELERARVRVDGRVVDRVERWCVFRTTTRRHRRRGARSEREAGGVAVVEAVVRRGGVLGVPTRRARLLGRGGNGRRVRDGRPRGGRPRPVRSRRERACRLGGEHRRRAAARRRRDRRRHLDDRRVRHAGGKSPTRRVPPRRTRKPPGASRRGPRSRGVPPRAPPRANTAHPTPPPWRGPDAPTRGDRCELSPKAARRGSDERRRVSSLARQARLWFSGALQREKQN